MGKGEAGGGIGHARRHTAGIVAAIAGATAVGTAAAVASRQQRRRRRAISPEDSLAGPPRPGGTPPAAPAAPAEPVPALEAPAEARRSTAEGSTPPETPEQLDPRHPTVTTSDLPGPDAAAPVPPGGSPTATAPLPPTAPSNAAVPGPPVDLPTAPESRARGTGLVPRSTAIVAGLVLVLMLGTGALVVAAAGDDGGDAVDPRPSGDAAATTPASTTTTAPAPATAADAFAVASQRLTDAGSFSYTGTAGATDVSNARPSLWLAVDTTVEGEVDTTNGRLHELSVAEDGSAVETIAAGPEVWGRRAATVAALADEPFEALPALSGGEPALRGAALLPWWLAGAVGPNDAGVDALGRRIVQATLPAALLGVIERDRAPVDGTVTLTLDEGGEPARVEIASSPDGPAFHLVLDIDGLGVPVTVETPAAP